MNFQGEELGSIYAIALHAKQSIETHLTEQLATEDTAKPDARVQIGLEGNNPNNVLPQGREA